MLTRRVLTRRVLTRRVLTCCHVNPTTSDIVHLVSTTNPPITGLPTGAELARLRATVQQTGLRHVRVTYQQGQVLPSKAQVRS